MNISGKFFDAHFPWSHPTPSHPSRSAPSTHSPPSRPPSPDPSTASYPSSISISHKSSKRASSTQSLASQHSIDTHSQQSTYSMQPCTCTRCLLVALHKDHILAARRCNCHNLLLYPQRRKYGSSIRPSILSSLAPQLLRAPGVKPKVVCDAEERDENGGGGVEGSGRWAPRRYGRYEKIDMHESVSVSGARASCQRRDCDKEAEEQRRAVHEGLVQVVEEDDMVTAENQRASEKLQIDGMFARLYTYFQGEDEYEDSREAGVVDDEGALVDEREDRSSAMDSEPTYNEHALATDLAYSSIKLEWHSVSSLLSSTGSFITARTTLSDPDSVELGAVQLEEWDEMRNTIADKLTRFIARIDQSGFHPTLLFGLGLVVILRW
ncbi:hypothetical protein K491DRAFT_685008 [Lophiostoma macrostomum CBS 122681]|uniref:Uncharacterized protein n=1 Tax=Lophiostoma macrostomum CBS 122681 TaxID=1314788 RepID=A0A6A6SPG5_9PLEO|nr:hypothetical protein K491DRAFT_685008 [Lophiostoma macrostomum CBS 122681]